MNNKPLALTFIGLGSMGSGMARNLIDSGFSVSVYNRTRSPRAEALIKQGATWLETPAAIAEGTIVVSMLSNDEALREVTLGKAGFAQKLGKGGIHLSMSTVSPETSRQLAIEHAKYGSQYVAAPVFGRPDAAAARLLFICQSGPASAKAKLKPVLEALGQGLYDFGEDAGAANIIKLSGNFMILAATEAMAEAFALAEKNGIDRNTVYNFFSSTNFACPVYKNYGRIVAERSYEPAGFKLELGAKDIRLAREAANASKMPMPLLDLLHNRLVESMNRGRGQLDWSSIELFSAQAAGFKVDQ